MNAAALPLRRQKLPSEIAKGRAAEEDEGAAMQVKNTSANIAGADDGICSRSRVGIEVSSLVDCSNSEPK